MNSSTAYWVTLAAVVLITGVFVGLVAYAAIRSREEGKHPQMEDEE